MAHDLFIFLHAFGSSIAFLAGCMAIVPSLQPNARISLFVLFLGSLAAGIIALLASVAVDWMVMGIIQQIIAGGLCLLALVMCWRAFQAYRVFMQKPSGWMLMFIGHIGFILISLFEGFIIIALLDLGVPGLLVIAMAILVAMGGTAVINQVKTASINRPV